MYGLRNNLRALHGSSVAKAELYERPLSQGTEPEIVEALQGKQYGVVATLSDGRRFLVVKGNSEGIGRGTIVITADHMSEDWVKVDAKEIKASTLGDFVKAGGLSFDPITDNGNDAALRMMQLP